MRAAVIRIMKDYKERRGMKKRNNFRKRVSRFMVVIVVSSLLSSFYSSVAFAKDLSDLAEAGNYDDYEAESEESFGEDIVDENELSEESEDEAGEEASDEGISEEVSQEEISEEISEEELSEEELSEESSIEELSEDVSENEIASEESGNNEIIDRIESIEELFEIANSAYNNSTKSGWVQEDDNLRYYENGKAIKNCVRQIEGFYYAFDYEGNMLKDILTSIWDGGNDLTICAQEDGKLLTDSWYTTEYEETYYFGSNGIAYANGVFEVEGVKYLFAYWGELSLNSCYASNQKYYISDSEGVAVEVTGDDGWKEAFGRKYYLANGQFVSGIKEINGVMYGFRDDCQLCVNNTFGYWEYNDDAGTSHYVCYATNSEGHLITNSWFENKWGERSYHGQDGKAFANGVFVIGETTYLFNDWGELWCNGTFTDGKKSYISDANGVAIEIGQDGWTTIDGNKYYIENGEPVKSCVKEIDGSLYGFDYYGRMYNNCSFSIWDENDEELEYYASEDGSLHANWWYEDYGTRYAYYGADGKKCKNGKFTIDGTDYLFDKYGDLIRNGGMTIDGINYVTDKDGKAQSIEKDGWVQVDNRWFYAENGVLVTNCVKEIKGALYYFNNYGAMAENGFITTYDSDGNQKCYAARNNGQLYRNEWYSIWNNERYAYLGNDGLAYANGVYKIDGTDYLFDTYGRLLRRGTITSNGKNYASDDNGIAYELKNDGWNQIGENWFYTEAGEIVKNEKRKINGYYYYFNYDGKMLDDEYYVTYSYKYDPTTDSYIDVREGYYAKKGGKLYVNEWKNGEYFGSDGLAYFDGVFEIDGNLYIFGSYGALRLTLFSYNNKNYLTDDSGIAHEISGDGWMQLGDDYVYIQNGQLARGITRIDGEDYYFSYKGFLVRNTIVEYNKIAYYADESGRYSQMPEGFNAIGNNIYFVENGGIVKKAIKEIDGVGYAFDEGGKLIKDKGFYFEGRKSSTWNSYDPYNPYESTTSGNTVNPYPSGNASYNAYDPYNPDGKYAVGYSTAVSKGYLPYTTSSNAYNPYYADKDGVVLRNKWRKEVIDGIECWSYFGDNCRKLAGLNKIGQNLYYMDILGIMQTGWQEIDNEWYFFGSNGAAQYGLKKINEKWYYFNDNGVMQTGWQKLNGSWYYFASGGARQTGWQKINGTWYYFASGGEMQTGWQKINGAWYYCTPGGAMQTGWVKSGTKWYYMKSGGTMQTGWVKLGSTWYYMDTDGSMVTGSKKIGNKTYKFSSGGACLNP